MSWDKLSMSERADIIKLAVQSGIKDLYAIRDTYNEFAKGGEIESPVENSNIYAGGSYLDIAKKHIKKNEDWLPKPYKDAPKGKNWRSVGYGFNDSGFRSKYPQGISKYYENGITEAQAEKELNWFLGGAVNHLKKVYGRKWDSFNDNQKAAIIDTYYQRPASVVGKGSQFYRAVMAGDKNAGNYLGVAGYSNRNKDRRKLFGASQIENVTPTQGASIAAPIPSTTNSDESYNFLEVPQLTSLPPTTYTFGSLPTVEDIARQTALEPPTPEELRRQERHEKLERFQNVMGLMSRIQPSVQSSHLGNIASVLGQSNPIQYFSDGGSIHIKPENRGKFTALKERTGHSASWFKENGTPAQKKMATFALNARKWKHGDGGDLHIYNGGELPEVTVTAYAPLRLTTHYPITSEYYPYTGHSELDIPIDRKTWYDYTGEKIDSDMRFPYVTIDKTSEAKDYNLVTNNCADATLKYLNAAFGTSEKPWLFTTPGDVRDYALKKLNGKLIKNLDGSDTVLIPRNAKIAAKLSKTALNMLESTPEGTAYSSRWVGQFHRHGLGGNLFEIGGPKNSKKKEGPEYIFDSTMYTHPNDTAGLLAEQVVTPNGNYPVLNPKGGEAWTIGALNDLGVPLYTKTSIPKQKDGELQHLEDKAKADAHVAMVTPTAEDLFTIGTLGGLNNLSPTQWVRRAYDLGEAIKGNMSWDNFVNNWFYGNNGLVSDKYAQEHPYASAAINLVGDAAAFGTLSALKKLPKYTATSTPQITAENAASVTPKQWTAAQDAAIAKALHITPEKAASLTKKQWEDAIARGANIEEVQKLRDLHFPDTRAMNADGSPTRTYHTVANEYDPSFTTFNPDIEGTHSAIYTTDDPFMSGTYASDIVSEAEREHIIETIRQRNLAKYYAYKHYNLSKEHLDRYKVYADKKKARKKILANHPSLSNEAQKERQKQLYVRLQNPVIVNNNGAAWNHINISDLPEDVRKNIKVDTRFGHLSNSYSTRSLEAAQMATGNYDGSIINDVLDYGGGKAYLSDFKPSTVYQVNNPANLKLADAVTFDDNGIRIPLGDRDNFNVNDIRWSWLLPILGIGAGTAAVEE